MAGPSRPCHLPHEPTGGLRSPSKDDHRLDLQVLLQPGRAGMHSRRRPLRRKMGRKVSAHSCSITPVTSMSSSSAASAWSSTRPCSSRSPRRRTRWRYTNREPAGDSPRAGFIAGQPRSHTVATRNREYEGGSLPLHGDRVVSPEVLRRTSTPKVPPHRGLRRLALVARNHATLGGPTGGGATRRRLP